MAFKRILKWLVACLLLLLGVACFYMSRHPSYADKEQEQMEYRDRGVVTLADAWIRPGLRNYKDSSEVAADEWASDAGSRRSIPPADRAPATPVSHRDGGDGGAPTVSDSAADRDGPRCSARRAPLDLDAGFVSADQLFCRLVIVTAFSENHRFEAMSMIGTAHTTMPSTPIVVYDIGIDPTYLPNVTSLCNVEVRSFPFQKYPAYVSNLLTYAWKIIIIKETLDEFGAIFWADTSARFAGSLRNLIPLAQRHHGYLAIIHGYRPLARQGRVPHNYRFTLPGTFDRLGVNRTEYALSSLAPHPAANRQLVLNSSTVQRRLIRPLYACALDEACISPAGARRGNHQFDASALMLVLYRHLAGEFNPGNDRSKKFRRVVYVHRYWDDLHRPMYCTG